MAHSAGQQAFRCEPKSGSVGLLNLIETRENKIQMDVLEEPAGSANDFFATHSKGALSRARLLKIASLTPWKSRTSNRIPKSQICTPCHDTCLSLTKSG